MSKVLYITANPKPDEYSSSLQISNAFIEEYKKHNPEDTVTHLDLYQENLSFLTVEDIQTLFAQDKESLQNHPLLKYVFQFAQADKYIFSFPLWNFGVPAILKAYIDYVSVVGVTFRYTENGPVGMLNNKKALLVTARGGEYSSGPAASLEHGASYMQAILRLFGIDDLQTIAADCTNVQGFDVEGMMQQKTTAAKELAAKF